MRAVVRIGLLAFAATACAAGMQVAPPGSPAALRAELAARLGEPEEKLVILHEVDSDAIRRARLSVWRERSRRSKIFALVDAIFDTQQFGLEFQPGRTYTAAETLERGLDALHDGLARESRSFGCSDMGKKHLLAITTWRRGSARSAWPSTSSASPSA